MAGADTKTPRKTLQSDDVNNEELTAGSRAQDSSASRKQTPECVFDPGLEQKFDGGVRGEEEASQVKE